METAARNEPSAAKSAALSLLIVDDEASTRNLYKDVASGAGLLVHTPLCANLLRCYPEMKISALAPDRNISTVFWAFFDIHERLVECSQSSLLKSMRHNIQHIGG